MVKRLSSYLLGIFSLVIALAPYGFIASGFMLGITQEYNNSTWNKDSWISVGLWTLSGITAEYIFRQL